MTSGAKLSHIAADRSLHRAIGSGQGRIAMVRLGPSWFAVRMRPTFHRTHIGDLRYDSGLSIAKHQTGDAVWHDIVPVRPTTQSPGFDSAGPDVLSGNRVIGIPVGDHVKTSRGKISLVGEIQSSSGSNYAPLQSTYEATQCGVQLLFAADPGHTYEYSAFFRGTKSPKHDGGLLTAGDQTVTADPPPDKLHIKKDYGSANDALERVRQSDDPGRDVLRRQTGGRWRSTIRSQSTPRGSVPSARPRSPRRRVATNASATAGSPWRTSTEACRPTAIDSTIRRARNSIWSRSVSSSLTRREWSATSPPADSTSAKNASTDSGERTIPRSTSRQLTLPEPSQIELSGTSR
jgi:hypothetical protein